MSLSVAEQLRIGSETINRWIDDPVRFVLENFDTDPTDPLEVDDWQDEFLCAVRDHDRVAAAACKGPGKTTGQAWGGLWFAGTRPHPKIAATSITGDNLSDGLWAEYAKWMKRSKWLSAAFQWTATRIYLRQHPETWFISKRTWPQGGDQLTLASTLAGLHADHVMFQVDEAGRVPDAVIGAAEGALTSGKETKLVLSGNCEQTEGTLWRAAEGPERRLWKVIRITGDPENPKRSKRINREEAQTQIDKYGRDSYIVKVNILGEFPARQADKLLDMRDIEAAMVRSLPPRAIEGQPRIVGGDVARYGDDKSIFAPRQGRMLYGLKEFDGLNTVELGDELIASIERWGAHAAAVDETGVGAGTVDHCRNRGYGYKVRGIQFGMRAQEPERFENRRAEMWWRGAEWVKGGGCLPHDPMLASELAAPIYWYDKRGRLCVESTDDIKKKIGRSPDRASAFVLTFADDWGTAADLATIGGSVSRVELPPDDPFAPVVTKVRLPSDIPFEDRSF